MMHPGEALKTLQEFVDEQIVLIETNIKENKKSLGKDYDQNCYGSGYDDGELSAMHSVQAYLKSVCCSDMK